MNQIPAFLQPALILLSVLVVTSIVWGPGLYFGLRQERQKREMAHAERLRAMELGLPDPGSVSWWTPPRLAAAIGVFVPLGCATLATFATVETTSPVFPFVIWPAAGAVGIAGVIGGTVLASRLGGPDAHPSAAPLRDAAKPLWGDPDAYDVAGRRG
jgi:hypothetical protein